MDIYQTRGIILKKTDIGEADRKITVFTEDFGKIEALAKGARRITAKLAGHLEDFCLSSASIGILKTGYSIINALTIENFPKIRGSQPKLESAIRMAGLFDRLLVAPQKEERAWQLLKTFLYELNNGAEEEIPALEKYCQFNLLKFLGYEPQFSHCLECQKPFKNGARVFFLADRGGFVCSGCRTSEGLAVSFETCQILANLLLGDCYQIKKMENRYIRELELIFNNFSQQFLESVPG